MSKIIGLSILLSFAIYQGFSQSITTTKHNLSISSSNTIKATAESEICIFCHTPHSATKTPLWNRQDPGTVYTLYSSSTIQASIGQPDGSSLLCLSCHDGTTALGKVKSRTLEISFNSGVTTMPLGRTNLSTNLRNDHPISFVYNTSLSAADVELKDPTSLTGPVKLEANKMQCTSCHDPHKNITASFLVATNDNSSLCMTCHQKNYWTSSTHRTSTAIWNNVGTNPWQHTPYNNVARNACENCHNPHNAGSTSRLMNYAIEENNCFTCHSGTVANTGKNIQTQFAKVYKHNVAGYQNVHDPVETAVVSTKHVECEDCHNPHATKNSTAVAPNVNGFTTGVKGVDINGNATDPSLYQYQICFRCHADSPDKPLTTISRQIVQNNVRFEFQTTNPSYHPIAGAGKSTTGPSLIAPLTTSSVIYCTSCHASDGASSPAGPHGSTYQRLLKYQYITIDNTTESASAYQLCYSCHSRTSILNNDSFTFHEKHIVGAKAPCSVCHDAHGINGSQGNSLNNSHLINFNTSVVTASGGVLKFEDQGTYQGRCYLNCHGKNHNPWSYP
jgi:predicted CXXCH cytochrome family protein